MSSDPSQSDPMDPVLDDSIERASASPGEILPFFSAYNMSIMSMVVLVPLAIWTLKSVCSLYKNVPSVALKTPAIMIFLGPLVI